MTTLTVREVKEAAREALAVVDDLSQIYLASARLVTHNHDQEPPFHTETDVHLKFEHRRADALEIWAKYVTEVVKPAEDDSLDPTPVWTIELECVAEYEIAVGASPSSTACDAFALLVGSTAVHPYAREWIQQLSSQSRYPALTVGMLRNVAELEDDFEIELPDRSDADRDN